MTNANGHWRGGNEVGALYKLTSNEFCSRRVRGADAHDLLVCLGHTGDCHYQYSLVSMLTTNSDSTFLIAGDPVPGYACGRRVAAHFCATESELILWLVRVRALVIPHTPTQIRGGITTPCWAK